MAWTTLANLSGGDQPLSILDNMFTNVGNIGITPCTAAGTNTIALTPLQNTPPATYTDQRYFMFRAVATASGLVTVNIAAIGAVTLFKTISPTGVAVQAGSNDVVNNRFYLIMYSAALSGFLIINGNVSFVAAIAAVLSGGGSVPGTGVFLDLTIPFNATITSWTLMADVTGSLVIDVWKTPFAPNTPPIVSNSITGSALPTLSAQSSTTSSTLTGWTTAIASGDQMRFNLNSIATITRCTLMLNVTG